MGESLTQRRRVREEALRGVNRCQRGRNPGGGNAFRLTVPSEEAPANSVPAAAVIQRVRALFGITGRKARAGGPLSLSVKCRGSTPCSPEILGGWRQVEASGIPGVAVECVEIRKNTGGEGGSLGLV
jgi:hypothetical protein